MTRVEHTVDISLARILQAIEGRKENKGRSLLAEAWKLSSVFAPLVPYPSLLQNFDFNKSMQRMHAVTAIKIPAPAMLISTFYYPLSTLPFFLNLKTIIWPLL